MATIPTERDQPAYHAARWRFMLYWGPVIGLMALIFFASAQPKYDAPPGTTTVYMSGSLPVFVDYSLNTLIKKSAHVITYAVFATLIMRALVAYGRQYGISVREASLLALVIAMSYALTDELHQAYVIGRHSSVLDIGFDFVGAATASLWARRFYSPSLSHGEGGGG
ncbi:MAG: VanZ family protein [Anaerolineae bacterium]|nr:VanZ family protein [Anaerolineae bacterium]